MHQKILEYLTEMRSLGAEVSTKGEQDLDLSRKELEAYLLLEHDGIALLTSLEDCHREAERLGLVRGYRVPSGVRFSVPDWGKLRLYLRGAR
jgi:hypothetical protein